MSTPLTEGRTANIAGHGKERNVNLLEAMRIYVRVVERGSISGAARDLDIGQPVVTSASSGSKNTSDAACCSATHAPSNAHLRESSSTSAAKLFWAPWRKPWPKFRMTNRP